MAPFLEERAEALSRALGGTPVEVTAVTNRFYGETVTVAGLLAGGTCWTRLRATGPREDLILLPAETLNQDDLFIDSLPLGTSVGRWRRPGRPAWEIPDALRSL
jgi:NifB/MoaA-like Fe-S oxidoreductase